MEHREPIYIIIGSKLHDKQNDKTKTAKQVAAEAGHVGLGIGEPLPLPLYIMTRPVAEYLTCCYGGPTNTSSK